MTGPINAKILVLHRREEYPGERLPEIMLIADETTLDENPEWFPQEAEIVKASVGEDAAAWAEVRIGLDADALMAALYPSLGDDAVTITGVDR